MGSRACPGVTRRREGHELEETVALLMSLLSLLPLFKFKQQNPGAAPHVAQRLLVYRKKEIKEESSTVLSPGHGPVVAPNRLSRSTPSYPAGAHVQAPPKYTSGGDLGVSDGSQATRRGGRRCSSYLHPGFSSARHVLGFDWTHVLGAGITGLLSPRSVPPRSLQATGELGTSQRLF